MDHYYVSKKLPTYPSPKPTLTLTSHLGQNVCVGEGYVGSFPEAYNDLKRLLKNPERTCNKVNHQILIKILLTTHTSKKAHDLISQEGMGKKCGGELIQ